jgi:cytochrome P450
MLDILCYRLHYVEATIAEISRINSVAPFAAPHRALKDTELGGYTVKEVIFVVTIILMICVVSI